MVLCDILHDRQRNRFANLFIHVLAYGSPWYYNSFESSNVLERNTFAAAA